MHSKSRITNKKRFFISTSILLVAFILIFVLAAFANDSTSKTPDTYMIYVVDAGDTLWDIAVENKGNWDVRTYLYKIEKLNKLSSCDIQIGQEIKLP